ncbi:hypothetical protein [Treponema bryantii]|uniref:hypothetical protein n=1 Tax=Treponema bryantii TaxID=163 RepID=UPI002B2DC8A7|nr:hypothetical protein TRBR_19280 [Treponema bryantii]
MAFSTLNESKLHNSLKILYQEIYEGQTETEQDGFIYDIVTKNRNIIEIQTKNLAKLLPKILKTIENGHNIKLIHPVPTTTRIELKDEQGTIISKRKSPKKGSIYNIFRELTGLYPVITNPHFSLEVIEIEMTEERTRTIEPVQSKNGRRRFRRNWIKTGKRLDTIINTTRFSKPEDYLKLLPPLPQPFCAKDLKQALDKNPDIPKHTADAHLIMWVLSHAGLLEHSETKGRTKYYKFLTEHMEPTEKKL